MIFIVFAVYVIGSFEPYYEGTDSYLYGIVAKNLVVGDYSISNNLLEETGRDEFVGGNWVETIHETAIPVGYPNSPSLLPLFPHSARKFPVESNF